MSKTNDYVKTITHYLAKNAELHIYLRNLENEKAIKEEMLKSILHPITAQYSLISGHSQNNNSSKVEQDFERRLKIEQEILELNINIIEIKTNLAKVDAALQQLDRESQIILKGRWIEQNSWEYIAQQIHSGIKRCRLKHDKALNSMAAAIFGPQAISKQALALFK